MIDNLNFPETASTLDYTANSHVSSLSFLPEDTPIISSSNSSAVTSASELEATAQAIASDATTLGGWPDIVINSISIPSTVQAGRKYRTYFGFNYVVTNQGQSDFEFSHTIFWLSKDRILGKDAYLGIDFVPLLKEGESRTEKAYGEVSPTLAAGNYYVIGQANYYEQTEPNSFNNVTVSYSTIEVTKPDLTITDGFAVPSSGQADSDLKFSYTLNNQDKAEAGFSRTKFYLSKDKTLDSGDTYFGYDEASFLHGYSSHTESASVDLDSDEARGLSGQYHIIAEADGYDPQVNESDETNNVAVSGNTITITHQPDLTITDSFTVPSSGGANSNLKINYTLNNKGGATANPNYTKFYLSKDKTLDSGDTYFGFDYVSSLADNSSRDELARLYLSSPEAEGLSGQYYIIAEADGYNPRVNELNETNNVAVSSNTITISQPDLTITNGFTTPFWGKANSSLKFTYTLNNEGGATASYNRTKFYLSKDKTLDSGDRYFGYDYVSSLAGNSSRTESASVYLSSSEAKGLSGQYYIVAKADGSNQVSESNENNNLAVSRNTIKIIISQPDLTITNGFTTPLWGKANSNLKFTYTLNNKGDQTAGSSYTYFYLSKDKTLDSGDRYFGYDYVSSLAGNSSRTESASVYLSSSEARGLSGRYYIIAKTDGSNRVIESNENNNLAVSRNTVALLSLWRGDQDIQDILTLR